MQNPLDTPEPNAKDVVKFIIQNLDHIDMERLADMLAQASWITRANGVKASTFVTEQIKGNPSFVLTRAEMRVFAAKNAPNVIAEMVAGNKIPAIKLIRQGYGIGLKEAKELADHLQDELFMRNKVKAAYNAQVTFGKEQQLAFNEIMEHIDE